MPTVPQTFSQGTVQVHSCRPPRLVSRTIMRFADLDLAAIAQRHDRQIVGWYALRAADPTGTGRVLRAQAEEVFGRLQWRPSTSARLLRGGREIFWTVAVDAIFLRSASKVAVALGVKSFRAALRAPLRDLRGPVATVRARLVLHGVAALRAGRPISNATIARMAAADVRTVKRWRRLLRPRMHENYFLIAPLRPGTIAGEFRILGGPALRTIRFRGQRWIGRRMPDSFETPDMGGVRSCLRRANRRLRTTSATPGRGTDRRHRDDAIRAMADSSHRLLCTSPTRGSRAGTAVRVWSP